MIPLQNLDTYPHLTHQRQTLPRGSDENRVEYNDMFHPRTSEARGTGPDIPAHGYSAFRSIEQLSSGLNNGFVSVSSMNSIAPNLNTHRAFRVTGQRLMLQLESQISCLLDEVRRIDELLPTHGPGGTHPRSFWQYDKEAFILRCKQGLDYSAIPKPLASHSVASTSQASDQNDLTTQRENLLSSVSILLREYRELLRWDHDLQNYRKVSRRSHLTIVKHIRDRFSLPDDQPNYEGYLDGGLEYLRDRDDFIYVDSGAPPEFFQRMILNPKISKIIRFLCCGNPRLGFPETEGEIPAQRLLITLRALMGFLGSLIILAPVGILFLVDLQQKWLEFVVVLIFSLVFGFIFFFFESRSNYLFVGIAGYCAVLVNFLTNSTSVTERT
ncbi:hypothetical protein F5Y18DRAFT_430442 [Xylariaceae sp. FL1019]|nr:hypothetical protein F5Y18DRAFT_430442 [Xylariaceae sp. FL1019]